MGYILFGIFCYESETVKDLVLDIGGLKPEELQTASCWCSATCGTVQLGYWQGITTELRNLELQTASCWCSATCGTVQLGYWQGITTELRNALSTSSEAFLLSKHMTYSITTASKGSVILLSHVNPNSSRDILSSSPKTVVPRFLAEKCLVCTEIRDLLAGERGQGALYATIWGPAFMDVFHSQPGDFNQVSSALIAANLASCLTAPYLMVCMISSTACDGHFLASSLHFPRPTTVSNHQVANFGGKVCPWLQPRNPASISTEVLLIKHMSYSTTAASKGSVILAVTACEAKLLLGQPEELAKHCRA
uniref:Uncharacterized protein n=1 Tax=Aegilops tauschii TaxID=37682 RepID=M8AK88_AEGTA